MVSTKDRVIYFKQPLCILSSLEGGVRYSLRSTQGGGNASGSKRLHDIVLTCSQNIHTLAVRLLAIV